MADTPDSGGKRVAVITADGKFATIDEKFAHEITHTGGRVLTKQQIAEQAEQEAYDKLPAGAKVLGAVNTALGVAAGPIGWAAGGTAAPTQALRAYSGGVQSGLTAGLGDAAGRKVAEAVGGQSAGQKYAESVDTQADASPVARGLGSAVGLVGSAALGGEAVQAARGAGAAATAAKLATPGAAIGAIGDLAETGVQAAGRALGYEGASVAGRAAMSAAELGARGVVEGGLYGAAESAGDAVLHDTDNAADKIFAATGTGALYGGLGGAALGATGSLLKSGGTAALGGLARAMRTAEVAEGAAAAEAGEAKAATVSRLKGWSNDMAANALGATKTQMADALEHVAPTMAEAKQAVGDYVNRIGIGKAVDGATGATGAWRAGVNGRADELLEKIRGDLYGRVANGLSDAVRIAPSARVSVEDLFNHTSGVYQEMLKDPAKIAGADAFFNRVNMELGALKNAGKVAEDGTVSAVDAFYARASMARQAYEMGRASGAAGEAYKDFLRGFDKMTIDAIDKAASEAGPSNARQQIIHWKREWQLGKAAEKMAEGGAEKFAGNNTFGIREAIAAGTALATGHLLGGAATLVGGKIMRERGSAVAAYGLARLADRAAAAQMVEKTNALIGKASKGLLAAPVKGALPAAVQMPSSKSLAKLAMTRVAEFQADPDAFIDKATRHTEGLAVHSPEIAEALVARQVQAAQFLASKVPVTPDPDPLDPHPAPKMTANEEAELGRYAWYTEKPQRFFEEVARGKMTFEGAETAQKLMPGAFAELQQQTLDQLATMMARGNKIPFRQKQYIGILMDIAATPAQRPDHMAFLQKNLEPLPDTNPPPMPKNAGSVAGKLPVSSYDRLESGGLGR